MTRRTGATVRANQRCRSPVAGPSPARLDVPASFVLIFPLLLVYEVGVAYAGRVNGADLVSRLLYTLLSSREAYVLVHATVAVAFLGWIHHTRRWGTLRLSVVAPVVLEAAVYALTLGAVMTIVVDRVLGLGAGTVIGAAGAGVHEEIVFRLGLLGGLVAVLRGRVPVAIALSAVGFALAHHLAGEPFTARAFAFRCVAGVAFGLIYWYRSLAHAVYAHALYDLVVALSTSH